MQRRALTGLPFFVIGWLAVMALLDVIARAGH